MATRPSNLIVMLTFPKDGFLRHARLVPGIHVFLMRCIKQDVDGRDKPAMAAELFV